jgi:lipopolysaccharide heptosyltransferase I
MRVAIVRLTSLGDVVHTLPVAHAIRSHAPDAHVVWLAEEAARPLLVDNPSVDAFVSVPIRRWQKQLRNPFGVAGVVGEFRTLRDQLRSLRLDAVIDVQGLLKSAIFALAPRAPVRVGFAWRHAREPLSSLSLTHRVTPPSSAVHVVDKNLSLLAPLGIAPRDVQFPLPRFAAERERIEAWLGERHLSTGDRVVALLPATRRPSKQWASDAYLELARRLRRAAAVRILVPVGPGEEALAELFAQELAEGYVPMPTSSIPELVELVRRASLVVGNDTGPLHIAAAVGVPTIGLFGPTSALRNGPYGPLGHAIASPTGRMRDIPVDAVFRASMVRLG